MNFNTIKVSSRTTHAFGMLKSTTNIRPEPWARLSLCLSLKQKGIPNPDEYNDKGTEFTASQLFGADEILYLALICNRLEEDNLDPETYLTIMTTSHINRGAISLKSRVNDLGDIHKLYEELRATA